MERANGLRSSLDIKESGQRAPQLNMIKSPAFYGNSRFLNRAITGGKVAGSSPVGATINPGRASRYRCPSIASRSVKWCFFIPVHARSTRHAIGHFKLRNDCR